MAQSMYNATLKAVAADLVKFVAGDVDSVDLAGFQALSDARAERKGRNARKSWSDSAQVATLENGSTVTIGSINAHTMATGDVLGALGYRGSFFVTNKLQLVRSKPADGARIEYVTVQDIVAAVNVKPKTK